MESGGWYGFQPPKYGSRAARRYGFAPPLTPDDYERYLNFGGITITHLA